MSRALVVLNSPKDRERAVNWIGQAPRGTRVEFKHSKRTIPQNSLLWRNLTCVATQVEWHGRKLTPEDWKAMFTASLKKQNVVPNIEGDGFVVLGTSTSSMSKSELGDLLELIYEFGAKNSVKFGDEDDKH